jgi:hypothetical protein
MLKKSKMGEEKEKRIKEKRLTHSPHTSGHGSYYLCPKTKKKPIRFVKI